jgi:putative tricarboxylic transport membrane protein
VNLRINVPDLAFAVFLVALGALAFSVASQLTMGSAAAMGPGYVPRGLSILIMIYGAVLCARALFSGRLPFPGIELRPLLLLSAAVVLFAVLLPLVGLAVTSFVVVVCAGYAAYDVKLRENAIAALVLAAFASILFVSVLGLPIKVLPW